jgi:hypothetical protein
MLHNLLSAVSDHFVVFFDQDPRLTWLGNANDVGEDT